MKISQATRSDLDELTYLFDAYRQFYKQESKVLESKKFLNERLEKKDSVIFVARRENSLTGFTQLYPTFSSVSLEAFYILNDLYVREEERGKRVGEALLLFAQDYVREKGLKGLELATAIDNPAQKLYEKLGWKKDEDFLHYFWTRD